VSEKNDKLQLPPDLLRTSRDILDEVKVGDWFWVRFKDEEWQGVGDEAKQVKVGEHEEMMCVDAVGTNYAGFTRSSENGSYDCRIHFDNFLARCRPEPNWKQVLQDKMAEVQRQMQEKTRQLREYGQKLFLLPSAKPEPAPAPEAQSMLPAKVSDEPKRYKKELTKFQKKLPELTKEIDELAKDYAVVAKDMALPDLVRLGAIKEALSVVEDRIFTIEVYAGLQETVHQIADGEPALATEKLAVRQMVLFMDEETLFDYDDGGMNFEKLGDFDKWVVKPENLARMLPEPKGVVAFRVRREKKDYGEAHTLAEMWIKMNMEEEDMKTYLLIRNGQRVYRIASTIDFSLRLIPKRDEIGEEQFKKVNSKWEWRADEQVKEEVLVTKDDVDFDDHMKEMDDLIKKYNRVVVLLQGLLDRSMVFHPHLPINLMRRGQIDEWLNLVRDEEMALTGTKVTFEGYLGQLAKTVRVGKWVYVLGQYRRAERESKWSNESWSRLHGKSVKVVRPRRGWSAPALPSVCKVDSMRKDGSAVHVSWPKGENIRGRKRWVDNPKRPGWGHYDYEHETDTMLHEWIPIGFVMNLTDYTAGDYKMFLCDRSLQGQYLEWAGALLTAEDWARERAKGIAPEDHDKAKARRR
jgi:hypothetical protein